MRCALVLLVSAYAFLNVLGGVVPPNPNDVLTPVCDGAPCTTPTYAFNVGGGKVIPQPQLCIVFWQGVTDRTKTQIADFVVDVFQNSNYTDGWSEYGLQRRPTLHPACGTGVSIAMNVVDSGDAMLLAIQAQVVAKTLPPITLNTHYVSFVGPASNVCADNCGYHSWGGTVEYFSYTVIPDFSTNNPGCSKCVGTVVAADGNQIDWFEATKAQFSRLLADAVTNPFGDAWKDPEVTSGEIGSLCYDLTSGVYQDAIFGNVVQKWYSQQAKACVTRHLDYVAEAVACGTYDATTLEPIPWTKHPYDCTDQYDHSRCMYCKGWANGVIVEQCLPRLGAKCNPTFDTAPRAAFCNLEFECSGSLLGMNVVALLSAMLLLAALFF